MMRRSYSKTSMKNQQGVVLIVALILLLLVTILGVSAVNISRDKTQIAGNSIYNMLAYQGAESALAKAASGSAQKHIRDAAASGSKYTIPTADINDAGELVNTGIAMDTVATIEYLGDYPCPIISGVANSTDFNCSVFESSARVSSSKVKARHDEARAIIYATH